MERLHMHYVRDLIYRLRQGESERRIARDLRISRTTVRRYRELADEKGWLVAGSSLPDDAALADALGPPPQPPRTPSTLEPFAEVVQALLAQGVEMTALWQRLRQDHGYTGSYSSVRRFVHRLQPAEPRVVVRVHTAPGEEAQVDFGPIGMLYDARQKRLRPAFVFVATLSYSRHQYAEIVFDQKTPTWIALHRRAFESWGGVPQRIVPDNLKAAVIQALVYDPILGEAYRRMAQYYGFLISPTRPGTPQHKGKVENGIHYFQRNFMAGQDLADSDVANQRAAVWVREVAGTRLHGTTHAPPLQLFKDHEQAALLPLPSQAFTLNAIKQAKVHADCHVTLDGSYYSAPYRFVGQVLDVHIGERTVQLFDGQTLVATHVRAEQSGQWLTRPEHYPAEKAAYLERTPERCRQIADQIGPRTRALIDGLLDERPLDRLRSVQAILRLEETVGRERLEAACTRALHFGAAHLRGIKGILQADLDRETLPEEASAAPPRSYQYARQATEFFAQQAAAC